MNNAQLTILPTKSSTSFLEQFANEQKTISDSKLHKHRDAHKPVQSYISQKKSVSNLFLHSKNVNLQYPVTEFPSTKNSVLSATPLTSFIHRTGKRVMFNMSIRPFCFW